MAKCSYSQFSAGPERHKGDPLQITLLFHLNQAMLIFLPPQSLIFVAYNLRYRILKHCLSYLCYSVYESGYEL